MKEVLFRVNAGINVGLGHISRCMQIAHKVSEYSKVSFCIHTDNQELVTKYISEISEGANLNDVFFIDNKKDDLGILVRSVKDRDALLVLDHYDVDEQYQLYLKSNNIHWMQLDSKASQKFYGDIVQHGSPGATVDLYSSLHGSSDTVFLLGPRYVIVNDSLKRLHKKSAIRRNLKNIFISFGGGYAKGALLKYIGFLGEAFPYYNFYAVLRSSHPDLNELKKIADKNANISLFIDYNKVYDLMVKCDLAILASGGMSYEAATVGLPSILIGLEDNQHINLRGCSDIGISISLGLIETVSANDVINAIRQLQSNIEELSRMSTTALQVFDGEGADRIALIIKNKFFNNKTL